MGTRVPSTMSTVSLRNSFRCRSASIAPTWSMMRSAADVEIPNNGASCRSVKFVRQYAVTSRLRSSSDRPQGRPRCGSVARSRRTVTTSLPKQCGAQTSEGPIQDGTDAVITPAAT